MTPDDADLEELFRELAQNISKTGATDIVIDEVVAPDFLIVSMSSPTKGTATIASGPASLPTMSTPTMRAARRM